MARGLTNYGGVRKPAGYACYTNPYTPLGGTRAHLLINCQTGNVALYDGFTFTLNDGKNDVVFTFDDDAAPPSVGTTIRIGGLASANDVAEQVALCVAANGFDTSRDGDDVTVTQLRPGSSGNTLASAVVGLNTIVIINSVSDYAAELPKFYGGGDIGVPASCGRRFGFLWTSVDEAQSEPA